MRSPPLASDCEEETTQHILIHTNRHWRAGLPSLPHVLLRYVQSGRDSWYAYAGTAGKLHTDTLQPLKPDHGFSNLTNKTKTTGTLLWQIANQSLNVAINNANANKSTPLSVPQIAKSYLMAVSASCSVALGLNALVPRLKGISPNAKLILGRLVPFAAVSSASALNVFLMRGEEIRQGIDVYPVLSEVEKKKLEESGETVQSLGKSKKAATIAVGETAISRVLNATPIMVVPPLVLVRLEKTAWLKARPRMIMPLNLGLVLAPSLFALPLALGAFPQRQAISATTLEPEFWEKGGKDGQVEFNRGM